MAELALAAAGIALSWKGILDFVTFVSQWPKDNAREWDLLDIQLQTSKQLLKEWGEHWQIKSNVGRLQSLMDWKKEIIFRIIRRFAECFCNALKYPSYRYGALTDEVDKREGHSTNRPPKRIFRILKLVKRYGNRTREKACWAVCGHDSMAAPVKETTKLHSCLVELAPVPKLCITTSVSSLQKVHSSIPSFTRLKPSTQQKYHVHSGTMQAQQTSSTPPSEDMDNASKVSDKQAEILSRSTGRFRAFQADSNAIKRIIDFWDESESTMLPLLVPNYPQEEMFTATCVLLYEAVKCQKLIFMLNRHSGDSPAARFLNMNRHLILSIWSMPFMVEDQEKLKPYLSVDITDLRKMDVETAKLPELISDFHMLLGHLVGKGGERVLLAIDGFEWSGITEPNDGLGGQVGSFTKGIHTICCKEDNKASLKVLIGVKGKRNKIFPFLSLREMADWTSGPASGKESMRKAFGKLE